MASRWVEGPVSPLPNELLAEPIHCIRDGTSFWVRTYSEFLEAKELFATGEIDIPAIGGSETERSDGLNGSCFSVPAPTE